jgi:MHS family proline/betaine transporter-like MFS transporter
MKHQHKAILGGFIGNVVEAYDISLCYFLADALSYHLLGNAKGRFSMLLMLIFLAYLAKPLGAFFLGLFSDQFGRKRVLCASILITGISTAAIGLIPSQESIGLAAGGLLLLFRILQSMGLGSEFLNSACFLVESGGASQRGFRGCWSSVGVKAGFLLACLVVWSLQEFQLLYPEIDWLWRVPFLLAIFTTFVGFAIRYALPESLDYVLYYAEHAKPTTKFIYQQALSCIKKAPFLFNYAFFTSFLSVTTGFFFYLYIPLHAAKYSSLSNDTILFSTSLSLIFVTLLIPIFGWISDKKDRLKMLTFATSGLLVLAYPFMHAVNFGQPFYFIGMQLLISIPCACYYSVSTVILTELFPLQIRCTTLSIVYSVAASLAAGLPPVLADKLVQKTHMHSSPAVIILCLSVIMLVNIRLLAMRYRTGKNRYRAIDLDENANNPTPSTFVLDSF